MNRAMMSTANTKRIFTTGEDRKTFQLLALQFHRSLTDAIYHLPFCLFSSIPSIVLLQPSSSRDLDPGPLAGTPLPTPPHYDACLHFLSREDEFSIFFPRRFASNELCLMAITTGEIPTSLTGQNVCSLTIHSDGTLFVFFEKYKPL